MKTIWKFPLRESDHGTISMPAGAQILHAAYDPAGRACIWALVDEAAARVPRRILLVGTGEALHHPDSARYVGTFLVGVLVVHVLDAGEELGLLDAREEAARG